MAPKKKPTGEPKPSPEKYRKPFKPTRVRRVIADAATAHAEYLGQDFVQYVNDSIRMRLEAAGRWPPEPKPKG